MAEHERFTFYLGTHQSHWLTRVSFPLFISHCG
jgi:hypothetical protein